MGFSPSDSFQAASSNKERDFLLNSPPLLAAVYASNLVIALYEQASTMLKNCGLSQEFSQKAFLPLFEQNCKNIVKKGTKASLTGPVERGDEETLRKHLSILSPKEKVVYKELSKGLLSLAESKNQERNYEGLHNLLEEG